MNKFKALSSILRVIKFHFNEYSFQDSLTRKDYKATTCRQVFDDSFEDRKINEIFQNDRVTSKSEKNDYSFKDIIAKKLSIYEGFKEVSFSFLYFIFKNYCDMEKTLTKALGVSF